MSYLRRVTQIMLWLAPGLRAQGTTWAAPVLLRELPDTISLRAPSIVFAGDTLIVAGNLFPTDADHFIGRRHLVIVRSPGGTMPIPDGSFDFAFPRLARDTRGALHLVWANLADSTGSLTAWMTPPTSLWHSVFANGRWSTPQRIFSGQTVGWVASGRPMTSDAAGRIHVAVPAALLDGRFAVVYRRIDPSGAVEERDFSPGAGYASVTGLSGDSLLIAYSTSDSLTPKGGSSIYVRVSPDGGRTWASPTAIVRSAHSNDSPPLVEQTRTGLDAFWVEESLTARGAQVLRGFTTRTPNAAWTEITPAVPIEGMAVRIVSTKVPCGSYALVVESLVGSPADPTMRLLNVMARDRRLITTGLFPELNGAMSVGIGSDHAQIRLIFSAIRKGEQRAIPATATGRACRTM